MSEQEKTRGEILLDCIYDEIDQRLNPSGDECWYCGGEGVTFDCMDFCADSESGCADCEKPCSECRINKGIRAKAIREEVIKSNDVEIATAWLKSIDRWQDGITEEQIRAQLADAASTVTRSPQPNAEVQR